MELLLEKYLIEENEQQGNDEFKFLDPEVRYKTSILSRIRIGQGAFRVLITDAYQRKCSITGEKTLPVLESAHIQSYSQSGPHVISNGILLRSDMHKLFDNGYITITQDLKVEVSSRIKEEFLNGKEYYQYHGAKLKNIPLVDYNRPNKQYVDWHNSNIFKG